MGLSKKDRALLGIISDLEHKMSELMDSDTFIEYEDLSNFLNKSKDCIEKVDSRRKSLSFRWGLVNHDFRNLCDATSTNFHMIPDRVESHNEGLAERLSADMRKLEPIEGRALDHDQIRSIVMDLRNRLVMAGAGTGKTTTLVGLAKYLFLCRKVDPEDVLFLSFTNASTSELRDRIRNETGIRADVSTFHRLGLKIIAESTGIKPKISQTEPKTIVRKAIRDRLSSDNGFLRDLEKYRDLYLGTSPPEPFLENRDELEQYMKKHPLSTKKGEMVKSYGEADIANYLFSQGIEYVYEDPYLIDTRNREHGEYRPDFHICGTNVYIEYFGIDRNNNVGSFFRSESGDPSEEYIKSIAWKKKTHMENGTVLIDLYAYNKSEGTILDLLDEKLDEYGIQRNVADLLETRIRFDNDEYIMDSMASMFSSAIMLIKGCGEGWRVPTIIQPNDRKMVKRFHRLLEPLFESYQQYLRDRGEIDFEDMVNIATECIVAGRFRSDYRYVVVDEYQDISQSRFRLLKALRDSNDYRLFCVGDDWQSIYRFNGSDIGLILDFDKHWGPTKTFNIVNTHRFNDPLMDISTRFILMNPNQLEKKVDNPSSTMTPLDIIRCRRRSDICRNIAAILNGIDPADTVLILGRYNHNIMALDEFLFKWSPNIADGSMRVTYSNRQDLTISYRTIHGSKGLQANHVIIVDHLGYTGGYADTNPRNPLEKYIMNTPENPIDEERRLFYVALTRARDSSHIITVDGMESIFVRELSMLIQVVESDVVGNEGHVKNQPIPEGYI